ncbi:MAG TPA: NAD-dependent epimerase/dehydratase family protein, partial [Xanthobacteraceae bacterium]|nr:NAD-dependent epimerase/dehydratase family protein [Xanthobacteraceae bacterium]
MTTKGLAIVTGGAGFIGSHMVDVLLAHGYKVRIIDNLTGGRKSNLAHLQGHSDVECFWQDIRMLEPQSAIFKDARFVFHFAGIGDIVPSIEKPIEY